jgi:hypothetical protein
MALQTFKGEFTMAIDSDKLNAFLGRFVTDLGATTAAGNVVIGHNLGLYKTLASGPATAEELAGRTGTNPRYVAEWLRGQAAGGYVEYDAAADRYSMTSAAAWAHPPSCWPRSTGTRGSPGLTTTTGRSRWPASTPAIRASPTGSASRWPRRRPSRVPGTT